MTNNDDVAAMVERLNQKAHGERNSVGDHWGDHICAEAAAMLTHLEAERDGYRDRAHYAEGTASLAIQHRDAAEKRNAELGAFVKLCADGFFIADDELQGAAMATLKEKNDDK